MGTFVPDGNKPIKIEETEKSEPIPTKEEVVDNSAWLNYFPGWRRSDEDEFLVDL